MKKAITKRTIDRIALLFFLCSFAALAFSYGFAVGTYRIFPYQIISLAKQGFVGVKTQITVILGGKTNVPLPWFYRRVKKPYPAPFQNTVKAYKGLNLITKVASNKQLIVEIVDMDGQKLHEWNIDWFKIWPNAKHVPAQRVPKAKPGTLITGAVLLEDGNLVFNFERLGLVRLDRNGRVVWRLPYQTHHSIQQHDDGNLWVCGQKEHTKYSSRFPNRVPPFEEYTILKVTPNGKIVEEWSVAELLHENGLAGLLHLGSLRYATTQVPGDSLHLNDVEPFPTTMQEDFFRRGDILVSLRNINTVFVFNQQSREIKFICTGWFVRQHDPDFIDGNRFSVFDNNNIAPEKHGQQSRIVNVSARDKTSEVFFEGNAKIPFYTNIMGKHQWLPNGNLLITESVQGRAFEINDRGEVVWEYVNYVDSGVTGIVEEVQRLPLDYRRLFVNSGSSESQGHQLDLQ